MRNGALLRPHAAGTGAQRLTSNNSGSHFDTLSSPPAVPAAKVAAIVVTFDPDRDLLLRVIDAAAEQVSGLVVVDNGSGNDVATWIAQVRYPERIQVLALGDNFGVAYAHNRGIEWARANGYAYALILDQDSVPAPDMVARLRSALEDLRAQGRRIAAAGPRYVDPDTDQDSYFVAFDRWRMRRHYCRNADPRQKVFVVDFLISSGSLIPLEVLAEVGAMDEAMFIDHVDTDWFLRAKSLGYHSIGVCDAVMEHRLGSHSVPVRLLRQHHVHVHSPLRLYYLVRNSLLLYRKPYVTWRWAMFDLKRLLLIVVFFSLACAPRLRNAAMMARGLWDGLLGRTGQYHGSG